jgi:hypothetical protein
MSSSVYRTLALRALRSYLFSKMNVGLARVVSIFKVRSLPDTAAFICVYNVFVCVDLCCVIQRARCRREETRHWHACLALVQHLYRFNLSLSRALSLCGVVIIQHLPFSGQALFRVLKSGLEGELVHLAASCRSISMRSKKSAIRWSSRKNQ